MTTQPKYVKPYNLLVRSGMWITVIAAALWAGGHLIKHIEAYLPFAIGVGIGVMVLGLFFQFRTPKATQPPLKE